MQILFLSQWFPYPPDNGSKIRIFNLLRGLAARHEVTLASFAPDYPPDSALEEMLSICREVHVVPWQPFDPHSLRALLGFFSDKPRYVIDTYSAEMKAKIESLLARKNYNLVIASQMGLAGYANSFKGVPALLEEVEQGSFYQQVAGRPASLGRLRAELTWLKQRRYTRGLVRHFKSATVVSQPERDLLQQVAPGFRSIEVIPNCISLADYADCHEEPCPGSLIFTGSLRYTPNYEAMRWFLGEVFPRITAALPGTSLAITGDTANRPLPAAEGVVLTGLVPDVRPLVASAWVSLAPLLTGGGTRLKILEAMALKTPVVATSKGAEGLEAQPGRHLLIADTAEQFAQAVIRLLNDPALRQELTGQAYSLVRQKYDWANVMPKFIRLVESSATAERSLPPNTVPIP